MLDSSVLEVFQNNFNDMVNGIIELARINKPKNKEMETFLHVIEDEQEDDDDMGHTTG